MNDLQIFSYEESQVRTVTVDEEPWFVLADVCRVLDLSNPTMVSEKLDDDEKMTLSFTEGHSGQRGGAQKAIVINESGLYTVIIRSNSPKAKPFRRWVTHEVLPSIRKTGVYSVPKRVIPLIAKQTVAKAQETRAEMKALGENPTKILKTVKEIYSKAGYNPPALVLDPGAMTMEDWEDMLEFSYAHKGEITSYEDYLAYLLLPRLES